MNNSSNSSNSNDRNMHDDMNAGNGGGQPEYGAYAPNGGVRGAEPNGESAANADSGANYGRPYAYVDPNAQWNGPRNTAGDPGAQYGPADWQHINPFKLVEEMLPQRAKSAIRCMYGIVGVAAVVLGVALLFWPSRTFTVLAVALGIYFVVSGVIRIVSAIVELGLPAGWRVLDIMIGVLLAVGGVAVLKNAMLSGQTLAVMVTLVIGMGWITEGVMAIAESWRTIRAGWSVAYGVISIIAGLVVLFTPLSSTVFLVIFAGCSLVVMGVSSLVRAFTFGRSASASRR